MGQLDYNNWMNCNLLHILEDNNITETHQKGVEECSGLLLKKQVSQMLQEFPLMVMSSL